MNRLKQRSDAATDVANELQLVTLFMFHF